MKPAIKLIGVTLTLVGTLLGSIANAVDLSLVEHVKGRILLQVDSVGEAWYVHPDTGLRFYLKDGPTAYEMMRSFGLGISNTDLASIPAVSSYTDILSAGGTCTVGTVADRVKGKIILQVESLGEAFYVHPDTCTRIYMRDGQAAYEIMRYLSLGITTPNLAQIDAGELTTIPAQSNPVTIEQEYSQVVLEPIDYITPDEWKQGYPNDWDSDDLETILLLQKGLLLEALFGEGVDESLYQFLTDGQIEAIKSGDEAEMMALLAGINVFFTQPTPTAKCYDGTLSYSQTASGTCSWHGGVDYWF